MVDRPKRSYGWIVLTALGATLALSSLGLLFAGIDAAEFEASTGLSWAEFAAREPAAAAYLGRLLALAGLAATGFSLLSALLSATAFRRGQRWAWNAMWLFPLILAGYVAIFLSHQATFLAVYYGAVALISAWVLLLSSRRFRRAV